MKIDNVQFQKALSIYKNQQAVSAKKGCKSSNIQQSDSLHLSASAEAYKLAVQQFDKLDDVRTEKVERIKEQIQKGTYNVKGEQIIDKLLEGIRFNDSI